MRHEPRVCRYAAQRLFGSAPRDLDSHIALLEYAHLRAEFVFSRSRAGSRHAAACTFTIETTIVRLAHSHIMATTRAGGDRTEGIRLGPTLTEMIRGTQGGARICSESIKNFWYVVGAVHCISVLHLSR